MLIPKETSLLLSGKASNSPLQNSVVSPEFIRLLSDEDVTRFNKLLQMPHVIVVDEMQTQLKELIRLLNPSLKLNATESNSLITAHLKGEDILSYGVWVYYPWSNRLVHLLDEKEFIEVRTSRNQYKITPEERDLLATKKIGVVGLSVGQSVSVTLAMERICGELRLADFDVLELTNLNRIRTGVHNLGILKVHAVAREIAELDPFIKVSCFTEGLTEANMNDFFMQDGKLDLLVEESDGFDIKIISRYKARELQVPVIMEASDRCMVDVERFDLEKNRPVLHGILDHLDLAKLKTLTTNEEKIPYMFDILGIKSTSAKLKASMLEMQQTITTWPQLASAVTMGGGITADVSRRILLNTFKSSGRFYVDIDQLIGDQVPEIKNPAASALAAENPHSIPSIPLLASSATDLQLRELVLAAAAAPSFANAQNWHWQSLNGNLFMFRHSSRLPLSDPAAELDLLSSGMAIENIFQKAAALKLKVHLLLQPDKKSINLIAQFAFEADAESVPNYADFISVRNTCREKTKKPILNEDFFQELESLATEYSGLRFSIVQKQSEIDILAQNFGKAEKINLLQADLHNELFQDILNLSEPKKNTGIGIAELHLPVPLQTAYAVVSEPTVAAELSKWNKGHAFENYYKDLYETSAAFVLVTAENKDLITLLQAGRLIGYTWLSMTKNKLAIQPICVSLSLLKLLNNSKSATAPFSAAALSTINGMGKIMEQSFNVAVAEKGLFLFRICSPSATEIKSQRKSIHELYFSNSEDKV